MKWLLPAVLVTLIAACALDEGGRLYNGTGGAMVVRYEAGSEGRVETSVPHGGSVELQSWRQSRPRIESGTETWCYSLRSPQVDRIEIFGTEVATTARYNMIVGPAGAIAIVEPGRPVTAAAARQPYGFPIPPAACEDSKRPMSP